MSLSLVSASHLGFRPLTAADLQKLQVEQFRHDETYHREIARLPVQRRLTHMTLHFGKYCGRLFDNKNDEQQTIADIFAITLSSANILGFDLTPLRNSNHESLARNEFVTALVVAMGKMSAACEKLDHLEDYPFKQVLIEGVHQISQATLAFAASQSWDLSSIVVNRLQSVRRKAFLPDRFVESERGG